MMKVSINQRLQHAYYNHGFDRSSWSWLPLFLVGRKTVVSDDWQWLIDGYALIGYPNVTLGQTNS